MAEYVPAFSLDLRIRIVEAYKSGEGSYAELAERFAVSKAVVGELVRQHRETGSLACRLKNNGQEQELFTEEQKQALRRHLKEHPLMTVEDRREALSLPGTYKTASLTCRRLGWRFKKRQFAR